MEISEKTSGFLERVIFQQLFVEGDSCLGHGFPVAVKSLAGAAVVGVVVGAERSDAAVALVEEVAGDVSGCCAVDDGQCWPQ